MTNIILVTSGKGGVGKSTVSAALAMAFASIGRKTAIVELDVGLRGLDLMLGVENKTIYDLGDLLHGRCSVSDALVPIDEEGKLALIAAPSKLTERIDYDDVALLCQGLTSYFDHVIIDAPAGIGVSAWVAPKVADMALFVATPDAVSVRAAGRLVSVLDEQGVKNIRLLINKVTPKKPKKMEISNLDEVIDGVGAQLLGVIPLDEELANGQVRNGLWRLNSTCVKVFENIAYRILGEDVELLVR